MKREHGHFLSYILTCSIHMDTHRDSLPCSLEDMHMDTGRWDTIKKGCRIEPSVLPGFHNSYL